MRRPWPSSPESLKNESTAPVASAAVDVTDRDSLIAAVEPPCGRARAVRRPGRLRGHRLAHARPRARHVEPCAQILEVNVVGVAHSIEAVLPEMIERGQGHIVGIASMAGYRGFPWMISYSASKAA